MTIRLRTAFFISLAIILLGFLYFERAILTPFVIAGIFAYVFNPVVDFFSHKIKLPRTLSILIIYFALILLIAFLSVIFARRVIDESSDLRHYLTTTISSTRTQIDMFPDWIKPTVNDAIYSLDKVRSTSATSVFVFFPKAISGILAFFIFFFAAFYYLKEGRNFINRLLTYAPQEYKLDMEIMLRKINQILSGYLRGQIFLVILVSLVLFLSLSLLGVRFALIIAVFSGIAEIVPIVGPIVAATLAALVALYTGGGNFNLSPAQTAILVIIVYFIVRQVQDYFVTPLVMGKITKLHPLIILFAVLAGGHSFGILGWILAVPAAAIIKLLFDYSFDKVNHRESSLKK